MIDDLVLCTRAVEKNKLLVELEPSFSLLAARNTSSSEQPNWLLTHLHNRKSTGESIQDQRSIYFDSPDDLTTECNSIIRKKSTIAHDGICFANNTSQFNHELSEKHRA